jgi:hypothetical protein
VTAPAHRWFARWRCARRWSWRTSWHPHPRGRRRSPRPRRRCARRVRPSRPDRAPRAPRSRRGRPSARTRRRAFACGWPAAASSSALASTAPSPRPAWCASPRCTLRWCSSRCGAAMPCPRATPSPMIGAPVFACIWDGSPQRCACALSSASWRSRCAWASSSASWWPADSASAGLRRAAHRGSRFPCALGSVVGLTRHIGLFVEFEAAPLVIRPGARGRRPAARVSGGADLGAGVGWRGDSTGIDVAPPPGVRGIGPSGQVDYE